LRYWQQKASSTIDQTSGVVTIDVRAFTPEDAHLVARTVLELSEALVNDMSRRAREDLLAQSEAELHRAEARLKKARLAYQELRNEQGMLDPRKQAEGLGKMMSELRMERIRMQNELATTGQSLSPQAPQVQVLRARLAAADEQIAELQGKLTGNSASAEPSIATSITRFDNLETEHKVAQSQYGSAAGALERARMNAERQSLYLAAFVEPLVPQEARYPRRFWAILGFIVGASFLWGSGIGVATVIRDHMA
jgi:capsular polysaccharide transport system permease protein